MVQHRHAHFVFTTTFVAFLCVSGVALLTVSYVAPAYLPYDYLGPLGWLLKYLMINHPIIHTIGFYATVGIHIIEGMVAFKIAWESNLCLSSALSWLIQTTIVGFPSLNALKDYRRTAYLQSKK